MDEEEKELDARGVPLRDGRYRSKDGVVWEKDSVGLWPIVQTLYYYIPEGLVRIGDSIEQIKWEKDKLEMAKIIADNVEYSQLYPYEILKVVDALTNAGFKKK